MKQCKSERTEGCLPSGGPSQGVWPRSLEGEPGHSQLGDLADSSSLAVPREMASCAAAVVSEEYAIHRAGLNGAPLRPRDLPLGD